MGNKAKKKTSFGTSMGISSLLAILIILVLVVFSTLSITTSRADHKLSVKTAESISNFYEADSQAEEKLAEIAAAVSGTGWQDSLKAKGYEIESIENEQTMISYSVEIDSNRDLNIEILADKDGKLTKKLWQVVPSNEWVPDTSLSLIK